MALIPADGNHKDRLQRINQHMADPFDSRTDHKSLVTDEILRKAAKIKKPPKSDDGSALYKSRTSWSDSANTGRR